MKIFYGPSEEALKCWQRKKPSKALFVPFPYKEWDAEELLKQGLAFRRDDFLNQDPEPFLKDGVVSLNKTMVVVFCDLKGSTSALRVLGPSSFRAIQRKFFEACIKAVKSVNANKCKDGYLNYPRAVLDKLKFMGDCAMFYMDCGNAVTSGDLKSEAAELAMKLTTIIVEDFRGIEQEERELRLHGVKLGARFGIALGDKVILSVLGCSNEVEHGSPVGDFTITGEVVNLAARLEHATPPEFLACITESRAHLEAYASQIKEKDWIRGTALDDALLTADRQVIDLFDICEKTFEIRADAQFRECLELGDLSVKLAWRTIPFSPRGFSSSREANLLGGNSSAELFRVV